jgi:hydrogenase expression/formation protein HypC
MCLSVPAKIISVNGFSAKASVGGSVVNVAIELIEDVSVGDYILVHTGVALHKISEEEAGLTLSLLNEMIDANDPTNEAL